MDTTRIISKPAIQDILRELKSRGFQVTKLNGGYAVRDAQGIERLKAMNGTHAYLTRYDSALFA